MNCVIETVVCNSHDMSFFYTSGFGKLTAKRKIEITFYMLFFRVSETACIIRRVAIFSYAQSYKQFILPFFNGR